MCPEPPSCRAVIHRGRLTLNPWRPGLLADGPECSALRTVRAVLADMHFLEDDEIVVTPVPRSKWTAAAERTILDWAGVLGYRRVWVPGRVVTLTETLAPVGVARVRCPTCGATWRDEGVKFWERVRSTGTFPGICLACGGSLPEWTVEESNARVSDRGDCSRPGRRGET